MAQWSKTGNKGVGIPDSNTSKVPDNFKRFIDCPIMIYQLHLLLFSEHKILKCTGKTHIHSRLKFHL